MKVAKYVLLSLFFIFYSGNLQDVHAQLSHEIRSLIENSRASNAFWAVQVRDESGTVLQSLNGDKLVRPASNLKLLTSGAVLDKLGPDYRFRTVLYGRGDQIDDTWVGDLIVKGSGDPSINGDFSNGNSLFLFEEWAELFIAKGIKRIQGDLIGFDGLFDDVPYPKGWEWDDLSFYYAPEISALSFNSNVVDLEVIANGPVGSTPRIQWSPFNTPYVDFVNEQMITAPGSRFDESYRRVLGTNTIILRSTLPQGYYETEPLTVTAPSYYFMDTFYRYLELRNIEVTGRIFVDSDFYSWSDRNLTPMHVNVSVPIYRMVERLNKESDNFYAEMLLKKLAEHMYNVQGTTELGLEVLKEYMHEMQFDTNSISLRDGSGLAPATLLNASELNQYLVNVRKKDYFPHLYNSLAVGGVSGTLGHRFRNSSVRENFSGKTGFVSGVRALSGYLSTESKQQLAVTLITNNYTEQTAHVDFIHQRILEYLYYNY
ncbi:MAG: D-alanyl-D-alanine carboxypeptidase/D-alanyl-D-alanine-endopeptidase [Balneolaceae bacterium]|nr:D-alanyl-D-alanine carboxypeptidase/D-alanyl-D-alanine-endopeptidase [Balneolaceae bacterium]